MRAPPRRTARQNEMLSRLRCLSFNARAAPKDGAPVCDHGRSRRGRVSMRAPPRRTARPDARRQDARGLRAFQCARRPEGRRAALISSTSAGVTSFQCARRPEGRRAVSICAGNQIQRHVSMRAPPRRTARLACAASFERGGRPFQCARRPEGRRAWACGFSSSCPLSFNARAAPKDGAP